MSLSDKLKIVGLGISREGPSLDIEPFYEGSGSFECVSLKDVCEAVKKLKLFIENNYDLNHFTTYSILSKIDEIFGKKLT